MKHGRYVTQVYESTCEGTLVWPTQVCVASRSLPLGDAARLLEVRKNKPPSVPAVRLGSVEFGGMMADGSCERNVRADQQCLPNLVLKLF